MERFAIKALTVLIGATVAISLLEHAGGGVQIVNAIWGNTNQTIATLLGRQSS